MDTSSSFGLPKTKNSPESLSPDSGFLAGGVPGADIRGGRTSLSLNDRIWIPMQDPEKIKLVLDRLNSIEGPGKGKWTVAGGYHAVSALEVKSGGLSILPDSATPLKLFMNSDTGEIRTYWAMVFDSDYKKIDAGRISSDSDQHVGKKMGEL